MAEAAGPGRLPGAPAERPTVSPPSARMPARIASARIGNGASVDGLGRARGGEDLVAGRDDGGRGGRLHGRRRGRLRGGRLAGSDRGLRRGARRGRAAAVPAAGRAAASRRRCPTRGAGEDCGVVAPFLQTPWARRASASSTAAPRSRVGVQVVGDQLLERAQHLRRVATRIDPVVVRVVRQDRRQQVRAGRRSTHEAHGTHEQKDRNAARHDPPR